MIISFLILCSFVCLIFPKWLFFLPERWKKRKYALLTIILGYFILFDIVLLTPEPEMVGYITVAVDIIIVIILLLLKKYIKPIKIIQAETLMETNKKGYSIVLDTETTGLSATNNTLLQISMIDADGNLLIDSYVKPTKDHYTGKKFTSWKIASRVNKITPDKVENAPSWNEIKDDVQHIIDDADEIIGYNIPFDLGFLESHGINIDENKKIIDVMDLYEAMYCKVKLTEAAEHYNYDTSSAHDSLEDVKMTLHVYNKLKEEFTYKQENDIQHA